MRLGFDLDRPLRVLAVTNMYPTADDPLYGGFVATQMNAIAAAGTSVEVEFINGRRTDWEYAAGVARVRRLVRAGDFDVVHAHYGLCGFVCIFQPTPLVVSFWGDDLLGTPNGRGGITMKSRVIRAISYAAARRADAINCESQEMRTRLPRAAERARAHVIPNGVDTQLFSPGNRQTARQRLGIDRSERLVIFPNTPTERRKRVDLAQAAIALLEARGLKARLWIVQRVPLNDMPDHFRAADCLLLTSDWEGSANVVKEALCCDLPVVSVDAGDARKWLALARGCRLVERNAAAIAEGLGDVLTGSGRVDGTRAREELSIARVATRIVDVYALAIERRRKQAGDTRHGAT